MLKLSRSLYNQPVLSLQAGQQIATAMAPLINPHNLKILGWKCKSRGVETILLSEDVRAAGRDGLAVNDESALSNPADLTRHQEVLDINFQPIGKTVKSPSHKLGKVSDFAYDDSMFIQQLHVEPPITRFFSNHDTRIVGRKQIKEVTESYILVGETEVKVEEPEVETAEVPLAEAA